MVIAGDQTADEYERTAEYIRRLCEGDEDFAGDRNGHLALDAISETLDRQLNGMEFSPGAIDAHPLLSGAATLIETSLSAPQSPGAAGRILPRTPTRSRTRAARLTKTTSPAIKTAASAILLSGNEAKCQANGNGGKKGNIGGGGCKDGQSHAASDDRAHDACDACGQPGQFICCELCPRVFHFLCVNPPITAEAVSKIDHWYCRKCQHVVNRKRKSRAHAKNIFYPLISEMEFKNPMVFAVPEEIRRQFDGIEADVDGTFINTREEKPLRASSGTTGRDFTRLVDENNETILCYRCGLSALHGLIIKCDYCPLSWHWDCLDPPLSAAPPTRKRWMCPNHADHALRHYRRYKFRKERIVDLTGLPEDSRNGAVVDVIDDDPPWQQEMRDPKVKYRISSSRIRNEFSQNARPCRIQPPSQPEANGRHISENGKKGQELSENTAWAVQPQGSIALASRADAGSVAEWLQSIVAFQQEVARFVMSIADEKESKPTERSSAQQTDGVDRISARQTLRDRIALLSSVAAQLLTPSEDSTAIQQEVNPEPEDASSDASLACESPANGIGMGKDASLSNTTTLQETAVSALEELMGRSAKDTGVSNDKPKTSCNDDCEQNDDMLRENRISSSDLFDALNRLLDSWPTEPRTAVSVDGDRGKRELPDDGRNKRKKRAMSLDSSDAGGQRACEPSKRQRQIGELDFGALRGTQGPENSFEMASIRAYNLVGVLLKAKGADALLNFLLSN